MNLRTQDLVFQEIIFLSKQVKQASFYSIGVQVLSFQLERNWNMT